MEGSDGHTKTIFGFNLEYWDPKRRANSGEQTRLATYTTYRAAERFNERGSFLTVEASNARPFRGSDGDVLEGSLELALSDLCPDFDSATIIPLAKKIIVSYYELVGLFDVVERA